MARVALVYPRANLDTVPCLVGTVELLARAGHTVDIFTRTRPGQPLAVFAGEGVRVRSLGAEAPAERAAGLRAAVRRSTWLPRSARAPLARGYALVGAGLGHGSRLLARTQRLARGVQSAQATPLPLAWPAPRPAVIGAGDRFDLVIGVDPDGLILAYELAAGAPLAYFSLELLLSYELTTVSERQLKVHERELSRQAAFTIVQDAERGRLLAEDNDLAWDRLVLLPNAPLGAARRQPSGAWHARFGLAPEQRVLLHAGSLGAWTGIEAIVDSAPSWPAAWVLVVHTRYDAESSSYVEALQARADARRVRFSLKPVSRTAYQSLVDGADAGIAFYVPGADSAYTQRNIQTIGLSSGKLAHYLQAGLPVIVNDVVSIGQTLEAHGCGVVVAGAAEIGAALRRIDAAYPRYSQAACTFFAQQLDFERAFKQMLERIGA